jgi:hypothetical protein
MDGKARKARLAAWVKVGVVGEGQTASAGRCLDVAIINNAMVITPPCMQLICVLN